LSHGKPAEKETRFFLGLFGKPAWEIDGLEGGEITLKMMDEIEALGKKLNERLQWAARTGRKLLKHGWNASGSLYDIDFYKDIPIKEAKRELRDLGLDPDGFDL